MSSYPRWKYILVILVLLTSFIYSLPNLYSSYPAIEVSVNNQISSNQIIKMIEDENTISDIVKQNSKVILKFNDTKDQLKVYGKLRTANIPTTFTLSNYVDIPSWLTSINAYPMFLGLDLKGGVHFLLQVDKENINTNLLREIESDVKKILIDNKYRLSLIHI